MLLETRRYDVQGLSGSQREMGDIPDHLSMAATGRDRDKAGGPLVDAILIPTTQIAAKGTQGTHRRRKGDGCHAFLIKRVFAI